MIVSLPDLQAVIAAFLASAVELIEALTIVLAVGVSRGWKAAFTGCALAFIVLTVLVVAFGHWLSQFDDPIFKCVVGSLLIFLGTRWLRKAILRASGVVPMHDEAKQYVAETKALRNASPPVQRWDHVGIFASFNGVFVEGLEVVFIVLAIGASGTRTLFAATGAATAAILVVILGFTLRQPLTKIPENSFKFAVGVLVSSFGTFWFGQGLRVVWPAGDLSLIALSMFYLLAALVCTHACRGIVRQTLTPEIR